MPKPAWRVLTQIPNGQEQPHQWPQSQAVPEPGDLGDLLGDPTPEQPEPPEQPPDTDDGPPAWWTGASQALTQQFQSEIDRRINQLVQRQRGQAQQGQTQGQPDQAQQGQRSTNTEDLREARAVYRETLGDQIRLTPEEREFVSTFAPGAIRSALEQEGDPDVAGQRVARQVADQIRALRRHHQDRTISVLEQRGALDRSKLKPGQSQQVPGQQKSPGVAWEQGQAAAQRIAQQRGLIPQKTNN